MPLKKLTIATRRSPLAYWQTGFVAKALSAHFPNLSIEYLGLTTTADKKLETPLAKIGGKGLFVKELENAILNGRADIAVHSIKDMPFQLPEKLSLCAVLKRDDVRDAFVSNVYDSLEALPNGAVVGTSSLRRQAQLLKLRPDLTIKSLRGNVGSRLQKLDEGSYDAIILAAIGLKRLGLENRIKFYFSPQQMLPAAGQGAIGVECEETQALVRTHVAVLNDEESALCIRAERAVNAFLGGSCQVPIAAYATVSDGQLRLTARVCEPDGSQILEEMQVGDLQAPEELGKQVGEALVKNGAGEILRRILEKTC